MIQKEDMKHFILMKKKVVNEKGGWVNKNILFYFSFNRLEVTESIFPLMATVFARGMVGEVFVSLPLFAAVTFASFQNLCTDEKKMTL